MRLHTISLFVFCISLACGQGGGTPDAAPDGELGDAGDECREGAACAEEGASCGGPCGDACSFCNILRCEAGVWTRLEVFPAPCFECGAERRCLVDNQYCSIEQPDEAEEPAIIACRPMPEACRASPTCECLGMEIAYDQCTGELGKLTVETSSGG